MRILYFAHSLLSCWNHGNAHFLRGVLRELIALGHDVVIFEPANAWSLANLLRDHGDAGLAPYRAAYPELASTPMQADFDAAAAIEGADLVVVHEWNDPALVAALGDARKQQPHVRLLFHDTHHRAVSDANAIRTFDLSGYDGVLAFGQSLADVYRRWGWEERVFVWHEAADTRHFRPPDAPQERAGLVWIGNWGDGERSAEIEDFLLRPAAKAGLPLDIFGVRYPEAARTKLAAFGVTYRGWLANASVPAVFAHHLATVHVPRRYYSSLLPGIPTIRVFEALACGIPLVSAPWEDSEHLFTPGRDYLVARDGEEMARHLRCLAEEPALRAELAAQGLSTIRARHSCAHRARELIDIAARIPSSKVEAAA
ncbi:MULTISPECIES: glycosyltransferase [unclassified Chelatococcus]|uniref:CgeB family protein n=1 Tax=unclassified Chelatococcus TaxID=2638111 RepID=UPI001BCF8132|nr:MULTISPECIES: glycosyltransferase [unclassified Chelatococcus]MBS7700042.1 glycosyltransferase [Chelatococcus sp. YT9]MBX3556735.1 glycosyltransferase [Chelatococcus sp.]